MRYLNKINLLKINSILLLGFIFLLPTQFGKHFFFDFSYLSGVRVDYLAPTIYLIDVVFFFLLLINFKLVFRSFWQKQWLVILGLLAINLSVSHSQLISLYQYLRIFELLSVYFIFKANKLPNKWVLIALLISAFIQLPLVLAQLIAKHSIQGIFYFLGERYFHLSTPGIAKASLMGVEFLRPYGTFSHPNSLAGFYLFLYFFVLTNNKFNKYIYLKNIFLLISSILVLLSFSKIIIITFLTLNTGYFILNTKQRCIVCLFAKILIFAVVSLIFLHVRSDPLSLEKRFQLIKNSLLIIQHSLFFGVGSGNYLVAQNNLAQPFSNFLNQPVHNVFLLFINEWGIVGMIVVVFFLRPLLRFVFKKNIWLLLVVLLTGLFDHYWLTLNQNLFVLAVVIGGL